MWNIRLHSCCRTPGGVAAGKFSSSVGWKERKKVKGKMSRQVILASVQQVAAMLECKIFD